MSAFFETCSSSIFVGFAYTKSGLEHPSKILSLVTVGDDFRYPASLSSISALDPALA